MSLRPCPSFPSSLAAFLVPALVAACGGNVVVTGGGEGGAGGDGGSGGTPIVTGTVTSDDCPPGLTDCGAGCVNTSSDPENCGKCFNSCQGGACQGGQCADVPGCPPGLTDCNGSCVNTNTSSSHCGGCFLACPSETICAGGECVPSCLCDSICEYNPIGSSVPQSVSVGLSSADFAYQASCGPSGDWPEISFLFTAPYSSVFSFDTLGSADTVIEVLSTGCQPYACNDDAEPGGGSFVPLQLSAGQAVLVVVEVLDASSSVTLHIQEAQECATCSQYISGENFEDPLCPGSEELYYELVGCICEGACAMVCSEACGGGDFAQECQDCIFDPVNGCGNQFNECANDI